MKRKKFKTIINIVYMLFIIHLLRYCIENIIFVFVDRTDFSDKIATMTAMIILLILFVLLSKSQKVSLSLFPKKFGKVYIIATFVASLLLILTPSNYTGGLQTIILLFYSSIVTPIFEEIIFRGYIWNRLDAEYEKEWKTYLISTILFALWHLGYINSIAFRVDTGLANAMLWKVMTGLCFGVVLGAVRYKTKNCYSTILLHGVMNIFGR